MSFNTFYTRIIQKHDSEANWSNSSDFIPLVGEIIVYDPDANYNYPRIKIGDGVTNINVLPFINDAITISEIDAICGTTFQSGEEAQL